MAAQRDKARHVREQRRPPLASAARPLLRHGPRAQGRRRCRALLAVEEAARHRHSTGRQRLDARPEAGGKRPGRGSDSRHVFNNLRQWAIRLGFQEVRVRGNHKWKMKIKFL